MADPTVDRGARPATSVAPSVDPATRPSGPLAGLRVVDATQYVAGPYCSMMLGDLGADVLKIERPGRGDVYRSQGPYFLRGESVTFLALNRNKRSIALDIGDAADRERLLELVREADVFIENLTPGALARKGLGYADLAAVNPRLIYCSVSGYGQTGPRASEGGYDLQVQAEGGLMSVTGEPGRPPVKAGVSVLDYGAAMYGVIGILSALAARERIGRGQHVDVSLLDSSVAWFTVLAGTHWATGEVPAPLGSRSALFAPYQAFMASDGWLTIVGTGGVNGWPDFCDVVGVPELVDDPRFRTNRDRIAHLDELEPILAARFLTASVAEWMAKLKAVGLPAAPINRLDAVLRDPQVVARDLVVDVEHPIEGTFKAIGVPIKLSETPPSVRRRPPKLGEHQHEGFEPRHPEDRR